MEFDTHLAQVQGLLCHANRVAGPLVQLKLDSDYDAIQRVLDQFKDFISTLPETELQKCHLFLFLSTDMAVKYSEALENADWSNLIGIAPTISTDLFLALSVELVPLQEFMFESMALMPSFLAYEITQSFVYSRYMGISFRKVIKGMSSLCNAICHNILTGKETIICKSFVKLLDEVLSKMVQEAGSSDFFTYLILFKASLAVMVICFKQESPFEGNIWKDLYRGSMNPVEEISSNEHADILELAKYVSSKCSVDFNSIHTEKAKAEMLFLLNDPNKFKTEVTDELTSLVHEVGRLSYECKCFFEKNSSLASYDLLYNILDEFAVEPRNVLDEINDADFSSLCTNACLEGENQHLWIKALLCHNDGLRNKEAISVLSTLHHMFDSQDDFFICDTILSANILSYNLKNLFMTSLNRLDLNGKLSLLEKRIELHGKSEIFDSESDSESKFDSEIDILETLNRLVAQQGSHKDKLVELAFQYPELVVKHILMKAVQNELFSTSVIPEVLERLKCVFTCPLEPSKSAGHTSLNLTEVLISDIMSDDENIDKECGGIQSLVKQLLMRSILDVKYFLQSCAFPLLYNYSKQLREPSLILLLQILLDVQTGIQDWEKSVNLSTVLAFLGQLLECFTRSPNIEDSEALLVRDIIIRNVENIFSLPDCLNSIKGAEKEWLQEELSTLSPVNRHYYSLLFPEWMIFHEEDRNGIIVTLSTVLPLLHVSEWQRFLKNLHWLHNDDESNNSESALVFCSAVSLIVSGCYHRKRGEAKINLRGCLRNLASVVKLCVNGGIATQQTPRILEELLRILEPFPETELFELTMFVLPLMLELINYGSGNDQLLTAFGQVVLATPVQCARRELGRHLKKVAINSVHGNVPVCSF